jgi:hypothetical protein
MSLHTRYLATLAFCLALLGLVFSSPDRAFSDSSTLAPSDSETLPGEVLEFAASEANASSDAMMAVAPQAIGDYLANPGIGWQEAHDADDPLLPETVSYRRSAYGWASVNTAPGVYDWSAIDRDLQAAVSKGGQFSFRLYTMRGTGWGGHQLPQWVLDRGATLLPGGEPDYLNCAYQEEWARFVDVMRQRYDGNPDIAFIDISGYGEFNEWSWGQLTVWEEDSLDGQSRQRLADMFIGGSGATKCRDASGQERTVEYSYTGFQQTQLLMPYGGIQKSVRYVTSRRPDVGIRHDCLGSLRFTDSLLNKVGDVIENTWRNAPIVFEFCNNSATEPNFFGNAEQVLRQTHGSIVHDNLFENRPEGTVREVLKLAGYRYVLNRSSYSGSAELGGMMNLAMTWTNAGYAPSYPRMGQRFKVQFYLLDAEGRARVAWNLDSNVASWMPADVLPGTPPEQNIQQGLRVPADLQAGQYTAAVAIVNERTGQPIQLAIGGRDGQGRYHLGAVQITESGAQGEPQPQPQPQGYAVYMPMMANSE